MKRKKTTAQRKKLVRAEHMLEADHDEAAFEKRLKKIARAKSSGIGKSNKPR